MDRQTPDMSPEDQAAALRASMVVLGLAVWHVMLEWTLVERLGFVDGTMLSIALLLAAAVSVAFYGEPWFASGALDRAAYVTQTGRLLALMLVLGLGLGWAGPGEGGGPALGSLVVIGIGMGALIASEVMSGLVLERWLRLATRVRGNP
jgi:hypothetical protein